MKRLHWWWSDTGERWLAKAVCKFRGHVVRNKRTAVICGRCYVVLHDRTNSVIYPPKGVRVVREDGTEVVCAVSYTGTSQFGIRTWSVTPIDGTRDYVAIRIEVLPARTRVEFDI